MTAPSLQSVRHSKVRQLGCAGPGAEIVDHDAVRHFDQGEDVGIVGVHAPVRVVRNGGDARDLRAIGEAEEVEVVDALLVEHRLMHRQRILVDARTAAIAIGPVQVLTKARRSQLLLGKDPLRLDRCRQVAKVQPHRQRNTGLLRSAHDRDGLGEIEGEWFFRQQVALAGEDLTRLVQMAHRWRGQHDQIGIDGIERLAKSVKNAPSGAGQRSLTSAKIRLVQVHVPDGAAQRLVVHDARPVFAAGPDADQQHAE